MNKNALNIIEGFDRISHGKEIDLRLQSLRTDYELIYEVAQLYFGKGELFHSESQMEQMEIDIEKVPWSYECPFCPSTKKLMKIITHHNLFYCWCCGRYGNEIVLIRMMEFCTPKEALEKAIELVEYLKDSQAEDKKEEE